MALACFFKPLGSLAGRSIEQPRIKSVALLSHTRKQRCQRHVRVVALGAIAADRRCHQDRPAQNGGHVKQHFFCIDLLLFQLPVEQRIDDDSSDHEPSIVSFDVDLMRIPFSEQIVCSFIDGMRVIVSSRIQRQFVELCKIEVGIREHFLRDFGEQLKGLLDQRFVRTRCDAGIAKVKRPGPNTLVRVQVHLATVFKNCDGTVSDKIIQPVNGTLNNPVPICPGGALLQNRLHRFRQKKRLFEFCVIQMRQQIPMMSSIGGHEVIEDKIEDCFGLRDISKCRDGPVKKVR